MRRFPVWPTAALAGTVLVLASFFAIVQRNVDEMRMLRDESDRIEHTLEVQRELDAILIAENEADAAARGFLLSQSDAADRQARDAQRAAFERLNRLAEITRDNTDQQQRIERLREAVNKRVSQLEAVVKVRRNGGSVEQALEVARAEDTGAAQAEIRQIIAAMEAEESGLLSARRNQSAIAYRQAVNGRVGSGIVSALLLVAVVGSALLYARSRSRREAELVESERRAREAARREQEARAEAEQVNREKDQFLAVLSHELRTPLNAVLGWTQILQTGGSTDPTLARALSSIRRNAEAQQRLVEDLLDVSRIIAGKLPIEHEPLNLRHAISAAIDSVRPAAEAKNLTLIESLEDTPDLVGDSGRIQQMAANLLSNAVKFTPAGGSLRVTLCRDGDAAQLDVADDGVGIAPELLPHIFDRFRQGDGSTTRAHGGLGLGLAIARYIVEAHGGTIAAESPGPQAGATFRVRLPYR
jgi:signal transduction histidine kinase